MNAAWHSVLVGLPVLLIHLALTTGLLLAGLGLYMRFAHCRELELLRKGNMAAAIAFSEGWPASNTVGTTAPSECLGTGQRRASTSGK